MARRQGFIDGTGHAQETAR